MITALSFTETTRPIKLPTMSEGIGNGIAVNVWVRRTGTASRQRIIQLGTAAGEYLVLGTGDDPSSLAIGVERGATRSEMICEGALPLNRWVKVSAMWLPLFQLVSLSVFDISLEQRQIGTLPTGALVDNRIAGGVAGTPFVGTLSSLEILQLPVPSWFGPSAPSTVWGKYPLDRTTYQTTVTINNAAVKRYTVDDVSAKNNDGTVDSELATRQFAEDYGLGSVPVLEMTGDPKTLFLSPIQNLAGALTLELWFNPISTKDRQSMIILADDKDVSLVVTVGGDSDNGGGHLNVILCKGSDKLPLLDTAYGENAGTFQHVAVTFKRGPFTTSVSGGFPAQMVPIIISLYLNGQLVTSRTVMSNRIVSPTAGNGGQFVPLLRLMHSVAIPNVRLGGTIAGFSKFKGQLSEFRIFNTCRSAQEIAANFLSRLVGNEPGLLACYRLEQSETGCVFDISEQRGVGTLQPGSTIGTANNLPLLHTSNPNAAYVRVKGKLLTEHLTYLTDIFVLADRPDGLGSSTTVVQEQRTGPLTVFDATLEPAAPDGGSQAGKTLQICPDADVRVYLPNSDNVFVPTKWPAKQVQSLTVPGSGKLRLRIEATSLICPTLRVRYADMVEGLWTLVRPDSDAMRSLATISGNQLRSPPPGKPSPLPAGSTQDDANKCGNALVQIGRCYRPVGYVETAFIGESRSILGSVLDVIDDAVDWTEDTASSAASGMKQAGSAAGRYASAVVDNGTAALQQGSAVIKQTSSLLCTAADELRDLTNAAASAVPRFGKDQIKQCIATADRLAVLATKTTSTIAHTCTLIGTTIVNGVTYAWRVVVNGVMDAYAAVVGFLQKVGADIEKVLKYLAWLFNWNDFLKASDKIYTTIDTEFGRAKDQIAKVKGYKAELNKYLTLPSGVGDKSLAQHCGINIPDNLGAEEIDYVMDLANTVMSAANLNLDFMSQLSQQVGSGTSLIDTSKFQQFSSLSRPSSDPGIGNPVALLTTPVQQLVNNVTTGSAQTSVVDFLFDQITSITDTVIGSARTMATARLSVPNVTSWVESTILGGRTLSMLRLASLIAAIAQVLAVKIAASASSGEAEPQPVSFADSQPADYSAQIWSNFALSAFSFIVEIPRTAMELGISKAANAKAAEAAEKAASGWLFACDTALGLAAIARSALNYYANARLPKEIQFHLGLMSGLDALAGAFLIIISGCKFAAVRSGESGLLTLLKVVDMIGQSGMTILSFSLAVTAASYRSLFSTALDWTVFGLQVGSYITNQASQLASAYIELAIADQGEHLKPMSPYVPIGFSVATALLDLGSGITNAVQSA